MFLVVLAGLVGGAEIIIVASHPRSGSTELASAIAKDSSAILQLGECLNGENSTWSHVLEDLVGVDAYKQRCEDPLSTLLAARRAFCEQQNATRDCAVVTKVFPEHCYGSPDWHAKVARILHYEGTRTVVLERDPAASECSFLWAQQTGDWGTAPDKHAPIQRPPCPDQVSIGYAEYHNHWFDFIRQTLADAGQVYLEVPFQAYANTDMKTLGSQVTSFAGLHKHRRRR